MPSLPQVFPPWSPEAGVIRRVHLKGSRLGSRPLWSQGVGEPLTALTRAMDAVVMKKAMINASGMVRMGLIIGLSSCDMVGDALVMLVEMLG